jgi:GT2 family glycosyltransferase
MATPPASPTVAVLILNWNGRAYLPACLNALTAQTYPPVTVTVIDNGSTDGSAEWLRQQWPSVRLLDLGANVGFAAGNNAAIREITADIVALLNPDVIVSLDWLAQIVAAFAADARVGVVGSKLWYPDGRTIQHGGGYLTLPQAMPGHYAIGEPDTGQADALRDVTYVIGGAAAIRRAVLAEVGLLDEGFFLYYEDVDYCTRARRAGWRVVFEPQATAVHVESATTVKGSFSYLARFHTGRWRYILKQLDAAGIIGETFPAERRWLDGLDLDERLAAALAYEMTLAAWRELLTARAREGVGRMDEDTVAAIRAGLLGLRDEALALPGPPLDADYLARRAHVTAPEFESSVPLVAALRTTWNNIATRWAVAPILAQQNALNEALAGEVLARRQVLEQGFVWLSELQAGHAALEAETRELALQLREAQRVLAELEAQAQPWVASGR